MGSVRVIFDAFPAMNETNNKIRNSFCCSAVWPVEPVAGGGALNQNYDES